MGCVWKVGVAVSMGRCRGMGCVGSVEGGCRGEYGECCR